MAYQKWRPEKVELYTGFFGCGGLSNYHAIDRNERRVQSQGICGEFDWLGPSRTV